MATISSHIVGQAIGNNSISAPGVYTISVGSSGITTAGSHVHSTTTKDKKMQVTSPSPVAGGAPAKSLFTKYVQTKDGYVGQVCYGATDSGYTEALILWESEPVAFGVKDDDGRKITQSSAKTEALEAADAQIVKALAQLFV